MISSCFFFFYLLVLCKSKFLFGHAVWADGVVVPCVCGDWWRCPSPPLRCCLSVRWDCTGSAPLPVFGVYQPPSGSLLSTRPLDTTHVQYTRLHNLKTYKTHLRNTFCRGNQSAGDFSLLFYCFKMCIYIYIYTQQLIPWIPEHMTWISKLMTHPTEILSFHALKWPRCPCKRFLAPLSFHLLCSTTSVG